ncbi:hypothetical protein N869_16180 [Cellulomonas bogoriensis 69B4 = DSM 16987]|uniref:Uncharacterized protein n=2 Tax=Cellulomonas bogoriensis TaxID=301388 RepID=A0A0A0BZI5_9CELL|nr:hypothetical protein N869_16180 [Cellulomonas bogoriensis 69B4 = DSM 16987]
MGSTEYDAPDSTDDTGADSAPPRRPVRIATIVWGLVVVVVGAGLLAAAVGVVFDVELAAIAVLALAGAGLLVGAVINGARRRRG